MTNHSSESAEMGAADEAKQTFHVADAEKREGIAGMGQGSKCERANCPGPEGWEVGFGLAGGGYGVYHYCDVCEQIKEKDCEPSEDGTP